MERLALKFRVSFEALVRRLMDLRAIRKDLGKWLLSGAAGAGLPFSGASSREHSSFLKLPPAPVISPDEVPPFDYEFRYPRDPPHWVRLRQAPPSGFRLFAQGVEVAGISFEDAQENAFLFSYRKERSLELRRDPENPYDKNAVEVLGRWSDENGKECSGHLGWVPKELAARLASETPQAELFATLETVIFPRGKKSPGLRFSIWLKKTGEERCPQS